jgi:hypothetical protein
MSFLSNQKIINELKDITNSFIKTRPEMNMNSFVSSQKEPYNLGDRRGNHPINFLKGGGSPSFQKHPLGYGSINGNTLHPDPLYSGIVYRPILNRGGAVLGKNMPLEGGDYSECSDYSDTESESEVECEGGDLMSESSESEFSSDDEGEIGGDIYNSYIKPAGKALGNTLYDVGKFAFNDVVVPVGKELLKKAIMGAIMGAGHTVYGGKITGTKTEYIHILKKINPKFNIRDLKKKTDHELSRQLYKILELGMHPEDLKSLHYIDALTHANKSKGGINGTKKELQKILVAMYPKLNLENLSKEEIVKKITGHIDKTQERNEKYSTKAKEKRKSHKENLLDLKPLHKVATPHINIDDWFEKNIMKPEHDESFDDVSFDEEVDFIHPEEPIKETKKRGRPKVIKEPKEKKPRGRPKVIKEPKEKKPRGRPKVIKEPKEKKPRGRPKVIKIDDIFNEHQKNIINETENMSPDEPKKNIKIKIKKTQGGKIKKLIGTKKGNRARGDIVAEVMKKHGLNLGQASKYVSQHNLY